jgi:hypothetical protein
MLGCLSHLVLVMNYPFPVPMFLAIGGERERRVADHY